MALQTVPVADGEFYTVSVVIENTTGEIQQVQRTITPGKGSLLVSVTETSKPAIQQTWTDSGTLNAAAGYFMTASPKGGWLWDSARNGLSYTSTWSPA